jgi:hypothetical protein
MGFYSGFKDGIENVLKACISGNFSLTDQGHITIMARLC